MNIKTDKERNLEDILNSIFTPWNSSKNIASTQPLNPMDQNSSDLPSLHYVCIINCSSLKTKIHIFIIENSIFFG